MSKLSDTQIQIAYVCDNIKELLLKKNAKYGDSAINPMRLFSNASTIEQIYVRIDDKLNRIKQSNGKWVDDEDLVQDIIGYLILLKVAKLKNVEKWDGTTIEPNSEFRAFKEKEFIHDGTIKPVYKTGASFA